MTCSLCKKAGRRITIAFGLICMHALGWLLVGTVRADERLETNAARLKEMTAEQKEELSRKRLRFDELDAAEKQRRRDLHAAISADAMADELLDAATRYNRWLANLDSAERSALLDIKEPTQRIARIKELMQQQEERRFRQYFANLPREDRETIYRWLGEFVAARASEIRDRLPQPMRERLGEISDDEARRRELFMTWQRWRRQFNLPYPAQADFVELLSRFTPETQKAIESSVANDLAREPEPQRTGERKRELERERMEDLVRTALYSRFFPQISEDELLKFYAGMKSDDPRRKQLEGKEGSELRRELQRMYNYEHFQGRGGPPGPPGGFFKAKIGPDGATFEGRGFGPPPGGPPPGREPRDGERGSSEAKNPPPGKGSYDRQEDK